MNFEEQTTTTENYESKKQMIYLNLTRKIREEKNTHTINYRKKNKIKSEAVNDEAQNRLIK